MLDHLGAETLLYNRRVDPETAMSQALRIDRRYTYADYLGWPDDVRGELIEGVFYDMSPAPGVRHQSVSMRLGTQIETFLRGKRCRVFAAPFDVRLPRNPKQPDGEINTIVQPDLAVICDPAKLDERGCRGAPDWVIEILSPATASKDQIRKLTLYEQHGVAEYWLVHPLDRIVTVYRRTDTGAFGPARFFEASGSLGVGVLEGLEIDWALVFPEPAEPPPTPSPLANP